MAEGEPRPELEPRINPDMIFATPEDLRSVIDTVDALLLVEGVEPLADRYPKIALIPVENLSEFTIRRRPELPDGPFEVAQVKRRWPETDLGPEAYQSDIVHFLLVSGGLSAYRQAVTLGLNTRLDFAAVEAGRELAHSTGLDELTRADCTELIRQLGVTTLLK